MAGVTLKFRRLVVLVGVVSFLVGIAIAPLLARKPPLVTMHIATDKAAYAVGEEVQILVTYAATADQAVSVPLDSRLVVRKKKLRRDGKSVPLAAKSKLSTGDPRKLDTIVQETFVTLQPGETASFTFSSSYGGFMEFLQPRQHPRDDALAKVYPLVEPGTYTMSFKAKWKVQLGSEPRGKVGKSIRVKSNEVTFAVR